MRTIARHLAAAVLGAVLAVGAVNLALAPAQLASAQTTGNPTKILVPWRTTIPANNGTVVLFTTHDKTVSSVLYRGMQSSSGPIPVDPRTIYAVHVTFLAHNKASAANGVRVYARKSDSTWTETDLNDGANPPAATIGTAATYQVPALSTGRTTHLTLVVGHLIYGFAIEYTAGADNPESWDGLIVLERSGTVLQ